MHTPPFPSYALYPPSAFFILNLVESLATNPFREPDFRETFHHIPHGDFASYYRVQSLSDGPIVRPSDRGALPPFLVFGHIRPFKKVPEILRAFRAHPDPQARLVIAGRSLDPALTTEIEALGAADARVTFRNQLIPNRCPRPPPGPNSPPRMRRCLGDFVLKGSQPAF